MNREQLIKKAAKAIRDVRWNHALPHANRSGVAWTDADLARAALAVFEEANTPSADERDAMAMALCAVETRSKAASLEEVQAGVQRWTRHRYEAERLLAELAEAGFTLHRTVQDVIRYEAYVPDRTSRSEEEVTR